MNQLQTQVSTLTDRLNEMTAKQSWPLPKPAAILDAQPSEDAAANSTEAPAVTPAPAAQACSGEARYGQAAHPRR